MSIKNPLGEVFGFPISNISDEANQHRKNKLCPYNNHVPHCTKDKANNPLGVCSVIENSVSVITCPIRFREKWVVAQDAADFFFPKGANWTTLTEIRLKDMIGNSAGNIDLVLVSYDETGKVIDFGALEIQAVYISGNIRNPFEQYMKDPENQRNTAWRGSNYPRVDYLSSSRKRLAPQLLFKGGILHAWGKKIAVAVGKSFFDTLPPLEEVPKIEADIAWLLYDLLFDQERNIYTLTKNKVVYTKFNESLQKITKPEQGNIKEFILSIQEKVNIKFENPTKI